MKHIKLFILLLVALFSQNVVNAQIFGYKEELKVGNYTKDKRKEFKKATAVNFQIDLSNATIMGLDSADFVSWYSKSSGELTLKRFKNYVIKTVKEHTSKKVYYPENKDIPYLVKLDIEAISEDAGINAILYLYKITGNEKIEYFHQNIKVKDGRMNSFDILLQENAEELGEVITRALK